MTYDLVDRRSRKRASRVYVYRRRPIVCTCVAVSTGCKDMFHAITSKSTYSEGFYSTIRKIYKAKHKKPSLVGICNGSFKSGAIVHRVRACVRAHSKPNSNTHTQRDKRALHIQISEGNCCMLFSCCYFSTNTICIGIHFNYMSFVVAFLRR